jgi:hypothetical protein
VFDSDGGINNEVEDCQAEEDNESAASMSDEEDDGGEILKEFMSTQNKEKFLPAKRTRKIRLENSVIKKPNENKKKGKYVVTFCTFYSIMRFEFAGPWNDFSNL